jgi:ribonuclease HII
MKNNLRKETLRLIEFDRQFRSGGKTLCGIDEAGRGPIAGPVVSAAVIFSDDVFIEGVNDSKKLSQKKREKLFEDILENSICYAIGISEHSEIDKDNILKATIVSMNRAVGKLKHKPYRILADGNFYCNNSFKINNIIHGDRMSFSIAAASIIAKVTRDRIMKDYENELPHWSFSVHKGYGTRHHIDEIIDHGFSRIHRRSFKVKKLQNCNFLTGVFK